MTGTEALKDNIIFFLNTEKQAVQQLVKYLNMIETKYQIEMPLCSLSYTDEGNETPVFVEVGFVDYESYFLELTYTNPYSNIKTTTYTPLETIARHATLTEVQK